MIPDSMMKTMAAAYLASDQGQAIIRGYVSSGEGPAMIKKYFATTGGKEMAKVFLLLIPECLNIPGDVRKPLELLSEKSP